MLALGSLKKGIKSYDQLNKLNSTSIDGEANASKSKDTVDTM